MGKTSVPTLAVLAGTRQEPPIIGVLRLELRHKLLGWDFGLLKNSVQRANRQFTVEWHNAPNRSLGRFLLQDHVAPALPNPPEPQSLQRSNGLVSRNLTKPSHR
jgi:hypothetical protein